MASGRDRRAGSQAISREVQDELALTPEELTRLVNVVNVQVKLFARGPDIGLDVDRVPGWSLTPSGPRQRVLIPAKDLAGEDALDDELVLNEGGDVAGRAHETHAMAAFGVLSPPSRLNQSRARIEELRLTMR